jgi:hypothetical protein
MRMKSSQYVLSLVLTGTVLSIPVAASSATEEQHGGHRKVTGVVVEKGGALSVKVPDGSTYQLNPNRSQRHGHEPPKVGDEVTVLLDENNMVMEIHPKGEEQGHRFVTGKLVYVGKMKKEIKLQTPEGEKVYPLEKLEVKTTGIEEGAQVTVELNEAGSVIDLHRGDKGKDKH